jgi:hypothetical protein
MPRNFSPSSRPGPKSELCKIARPRTTSTQPNSLDERHRSEICSWCAIWFYCAICSAGWTRDRCDLSIDLIHLVLCFGCRLGPAPPMLPSAFVVRPSGPDF